MRLKCTTRLTKGLSREKAGMLAENVSPPFVTTMV
jgi:hypothetical protein